MGTGKKEAVRKERQGESGLRNVKVKGENFFRYISIQDALRWILISGFSTAKKVRTLNMLKGGAAQRNSQGRITKAASYRNRSFPETFLLVRFIPLLREPALETMLLLLKLASTLEMLTLVDHRIA